MSLLRSRGSGGFAHGGEDRAEHADASGADRDRAGGAGYRGWMWSWFLALGGWVHVGRYVRGPRLMFLDHLDGPAPLRGSAAGPDTLSKVGNARLRAATGWRILHSGYGCVSARI